jgi:hypothetical protein
MTTNARSIAVAAHLDLQPFESNMETWHEFASRGKESVGYEQWVAVCRVELFLDFS